MSEASESVADGGGEEGECGKEGFGDEEEHILAMCPVGG